MITAVQSIEKQFHIPSRMSGTLISAHDIGYIPTVVILSYLGSKGNRARWIGAGCLLMALANFLISMPNFIFPETPPVWNETAVDVLLAPPAYLARPDVTPQELLNYPPVKKHMPEHVWNMLMEKAEGKDEPAFDPLAEMFGLDFDFDEPDDEEVTNRTLVRHKRRMGGPKPTPDPEMVALMFSVMTGDTNISHFATILQRKILDGPPDYIKHKIMKASSMPFGYCNPTINKLKDLIEVTKCQESSTNNAAVGIVFGALILVGIGHTMPWSLGVPLIDDNVKRRSLPVYFAFMFFIKIMGPIVGFFVGAGANRMYYTLKQPIGLTPMDPRWIGAWWLGFLIISIILFGPSLALFCFPSKTTKQLQEDTENRAKSEQNQKRSLQLVDKHRMKRLQQEGDNSSALKSFWVALIFVLKSPIYTGSLIGRVFDAFAFKGFYVFLPKYLDNHYGIPQYKASMFMGSFGIVGFATGMLSGSFLMRRLNLEGRKAAAWVGVCSLLSAVISFSKIGLGCHSVVNSIGKVGLENNFNFTLGCNQDCLCDPVDMMPVCSQSGQVYYSPCHAGCKNMTILDRTTFKMNFAQCSCVDVGDQVSRDWCEDDCTTMIVLYFALATLGGFVGGLGLIPAILIVLRAVPPEHRSISIGFSGFVVSIGTMAAPIFFGYIIDTTCLLWEQTCTGTGSCSIYEPNQLRNRLHFMYGILRAIALFFDIWVWYFAKDLNLMKEDDTESEAEINGVPKLKENPNVPVVNVYDENDHIDSTTTVL